MAPSNSEMIETSLGDMVLRDTVSLDSRSSDNSKGPYKCRATQLTPRFDLLLPNEPVFFDDEFQIFKGPGDHQWRHRHGRVTVVGSSGQVIYDVYAAYPRVDGVYKRCPPPRFGVAKPDLLKVNGSQPARIVERELKRIFHGRTVVVHGGTHDLTSFFFEKDAFSFEKNGVTVEDTQKIYSDLQDDGTPGLATTARLELGKNIQEGGFHSPVEDAQTTAELYLRKFPYDHAAEKTKFLAEKAKLAKERTKLAHQKKAKIFAEKKAKLAAEKAKQQEKKAKLQEKKAKQQENEMQQRGGAKGTPATQST